MRPARSEASPRPSFVSTQVTEARRYYLNLTPRVQDELTIVCGGCERVRPDYVVQRETFPFFALEFVADGEGTLELAGKRYRLRPGMVFCYGPGAAHVIRSDAERPMLKYYVDFAGLAGQQMLEASPLHGWSAVQVSAIGEVLELFEILQREGASASPYGAQLCAALLPIIVMKVAERSVPAGTVEPRAIATYQRVKLWLEQNFIRVRTVEEVAGACHLDVAYLCRLFRRFAHTSPYQFLMRLKMSHAAELLLDGGLLVKEVAADLAFPDPFQFSRAFKRVFGLSPEQFVRQARETSGASLPPR